MSQRPPDTAAFGRRKPVLGSATAYGERQPSPVWNTGASAFVIPHSPIARPARQPAPQPFLAEPAKPYLPRHRKAVQAQPGTRDRVQTPLRPGAVRTTAFQTSTDQPAAGAPLCFSKRLGMFAFVLGTVSYHIGKDLLVRGATAPGSTIQIFLALLFGLLALRYVALAFTRERSHDAQPIPFLDWFGSKGSPPPLAHAALGLMPGRMVAAGTPLTVRYSWRIGLIAMALLGMSYKGFNTWMTDPHWGKDAWVPLTLAIGFGAIGLGWLSRLLSRAPALQIDDAGVKGFTLLGTKFIAWQDVKHVEIKWDKIYKRQLVIHAFVLSNSGGLGVTGIPILLGTVDASLDKMVRAIRSYRPDVPIDKMPEPGPMLRFIMWAHEKMVQGHSHSHH